MRWTRSGLTSKIHALVDASGLPVRLAVTPGEAHDNRLAGKLLSRPKAGSMLLADRGYDADRIREFAAAKGARVNIPRKSNRNNPICFGPYLYRTRNWVERLFNKIKHCRRVATRYDKLAANYLALVELASIRLWLRANESTPSWLNRILHPRSGGPVSRHFLCILASSPDESIQRPRFCG
jgi:transposase